MFDNWEVSLENCFNLNLMHLTYSQIKYRIPVTKICELYHVIRLQIPLNSWLNTGVFLFGLDQTEVK